MLLSGGNFYITPKGCGVIAIVGSFIGFLAAVRMVSSSIPENIMGHVVSCSICLVFFEVYLIASEGTLSVFEGIFKNTDIIKVFDVFEKSSSILILIYVVFMAINSLGGLPKKQKQAILTKTRSAFGLKKKEKKEEINT